MSDPRNIRVVYYNLSHPVLFKCWLDPIKTWEQTQRPGRDPVASQWAW